MSIPQQPQSPLEHEQSEGEYQNDDEDESCTVISSPVNSSLFYDDYENEDCAPVDFQVASDSDEDEKFDDILTSPVPPAKAAFTEKIPCPLCSRKRQRFTCVKCLLNGDFCVQNKLPGKSASYIKVTDRCVHVIFCLFV
jgi:hypothetical protein